jgi:hypothetical protein
LAVNQRDIKCELQGGRPAEVGLLQANHETSEEVLRELKMERPISLSLIASNYILSLVCLRVLVLQRVRKFEAVLGRLV